MARLTRRRLLRFGAASIAAGCGIGSLTGVGMTQERSERRSQADQDRGRLTARPGPPTNVGPVGLQPLGLEEKRDGLLYVPASYQEDRPSPLVVMLHGAGGSARGGLAPLLGLADAYSLILLAVDSRRQSWDVVIGEFGPDVAFLDRALAGTFARYAIDALRVAAEGFSDGASYALSLGITNGDLFSHVMAFSPGFIASGEQEGAPRLYVSHGTQDEVLPIDRCSRRIVPLMQRAGYDVRYREFDGSHTVPPEIAQEAVIWFTEV
jgi:phospholipase/carboxylesterase